MGKLNLLSSWVWRQVFRNNLRYFFELGCVNVSQGKRPGKARVTEFWVHRESPLAVLSLTSHYLLGGWGWSKVF